MAVILNDIDIKSLLGKAIIDGDESCIRPNSYILRLGSEGEFLNTGKEFELGKKKKGIKLQPGHSVALTAFETLDFSRETVHSIFPDNDLHGILSPTTDLSREGIVAPSTQVDAGYKGTINWTLTNTASDERRFIFKERLYRLTIFKLEKGETPESVYAGDYQLQMGYVRSQRLGPPAGMKDAEWEDAPVKGGPEDLLDNLLKSGYPWHALGQRLKFIDMQMKTVSDEYSSIDDAISKLTNQVDQIEKKQRESENTVRKVLREEAASLQNRWLIGSGMILFAVVGVILTAISSDATRDFLTAHGTAIGIVFVIVAVIVLFVISRQK